MARRDLEIASAAGPVAVRVTTPAARPTAILILQLGTLSQPADGDLLGDALARTAGMATYAVPALDHGVSPARLHGDRLEAVVGRARAENPGVAVMVAGVSLGSAIALNWAVHHNVEEVPVVAMSPVVMSRLSYLGPRALGRVMAGLVSKRWGLRRVPSPVSAGIPLTTNPQSREYELVDPAATVPANLFGDNLRMLAETTLRASRSPFPLLVVEAGGDAVTYNGATGLWSRVLRMDDVSEVRIRRAAHDLSQETNHAALVSVIANWGASRLAAQRGAQIG